MKVTIAIETRGVRVVVKLDDEQYKEMQRCLKNEPTDEGRPIAAIESTDGRDEKSILLVYKD
ncbi:hypothetical protein KJ903_02660 [Patescibacteria group bacterium]|nr:hypothetical protein [Patescibacteria group bacterium]